MAWGYLGDSRSRRVLAYATPWSRLTRQKIDKPENFFHAFPGFITAIGDTPTANTIRCVFQNGAISAVFFDAGDPIPRKVISREVRSEEWDDETLLKARHNLLQECNPNAEYSLAPGLIAGDGYSIGHDDRMKMRHRIIGDGAPTSVQQWLPLRGKALWAADIRSPAFAIKEGKSRKQSKQLWVALQAAGVFAAILVLMQLSVWTLGIVNSFRYNKIAQQNPAVMLVANKQTLANRLIQTSEEELRPFGMLNTINAPRPDSVFFRSAVSRAFNILELEGEAGDVNAVNRYADTLLALPIVRAVENTPRTQRGQTTFQMIVHFNEVPPSPVIAATESTETNEPAE
ncbi:MAG: hypothetical protein LR015_04220 [Verrucomicrobia bacterium]|nr:hypothetical protein [Verrucomicrobiota bacterium]